MPIKGRANVDNAINELVESKSKSLKAIFYQALSEVQIGTPRDSGLAANNWFLSVNKSSSKTTNSLNGNTISYSKMPKSVIDKTIYYTNNLPYIEGLEYGHKSNQAPNGWVRGVLIRAKQAVKKL